jgi:hypothetical protein
MGRPYDAGATDVNGGELPDDAPTRQVGSGVLG